MKYKLGLVLLFISVLGFAQSETTGKLKTVVVTNYELGYVLHKPANTKDKKPLIVFISGDGEKGTDIEKVKVHGPLKYLKTNTLDALCFGAAMQRTGELGYRINLRTDFKNSEREQN